MPRIYSVKIFGQKYKIDYNHSDPDSYGMCFSDRNRISIRHKLPEDKLQRVLMHEIAHAVIHESLLSLRKRFDVEEVCDIVGYHIVDTLRDNPQLVEWLLGKQEEENYDPR
jgi:Zn-dependent peptidase ImmA (M78 family)